MEKLKSRKFWVSVVSGLLIVFNDGLGLNLPAETIIAFALVVTGYVFSEAYVDSKKTIIQSVEK